jgi:ketosteroid isomerase-like protein
MFTDPAKQEVWKVLRALNDAWTKGNPDDLVGYFHKDMVAIVPAVRQRLEGRDACVASWKGFALSARIHQWSEIDPDIQLFGNTAVVTYYFEMSCEMEGRTVSFTGRDMIVFLKENGTWRVIADQFSPYPQ